MDERGRSQTGRDIGAGRERWLKQTQAADFLGVSCRQAKRLYTRYREGGAAGWVHGNAGGLSNRAKPEKLRQEVIELVRKHYSGGPGERFGPTLASEHLAEEHGVQIDSETLRRWMLAAGLWTRERKRKPYRPQRLRRAHFGELPQLDGSFQHWLEDRGLPGCLLNLVDDATGTALAAFAHDETTWAVADLVRAWVERYGLPRAIYTDWKSVYHAPPEKEEVAPQLSQFRNMCQAVHTFDCGEFAPGQRPRGAASRRPSGSAGEEDATACDLRLQSGQSLFGRKLPARTQCALFDPPTDPIDMHEPLQRKLDLNRVFCLEHRRTVGNDWVVRFENQLLQLAPDQIAAGMIVKVQQYRDGSLHLWHNGCELRWQSISERPAKPVPDPRFRRRGITALPATHPWRREPTLPVRARSLQR